MVYFKYLRFLNEFTIGKQQVCTINHFFFKPNLTVLSRNIIFKKKTLSVLNEGLNLIWIFYVG